VETEPRLSGPSFNDATYSLQAAARGEGIAMARRSLVAEDLERGTLVKLFPLEVKIAECYWFVCPKENLAQPKVEAFRAWVKSEIGATRVGGSRS
jgi:LysR family glycine cleavage system transcriptional activator